MGTSLFEIHMQTSHCWMNLSWGRIFCVLAWVLFSCFHLVRWWKRKYSTDAFSDIYLDARKNRTIFDFGYIWVFVIIFTHRFTAQAQVTQKRSSLIVCNRQAHRFIHIKTAPSWRNRKNEKKEILRSRLSFANIHIRSFSGKITMEYTHISSHKAEITYQRLPHFLL